MNLPQSFSIQRTEKYFLNNYEVSNCTNDGVCRITDIQKKLLVDCHETKSDFHIFLSPPYFREKDLIRRLQYCVVQKTHTHTVIILDFWGYLLKEKKTLLPCREKNNFFN